MNSYESLLARIALVRRRWRSQVVVKGISLFLASAIALLILCVWGADLFGFKPAAVWMMRAISAGAILFVAWRFLYLPLTFESAMCKSPNTLRKIIRSWRIALSPRWSMGRKIRQAASMIDLLIKDALDKTNRIDFSIFVKSKRLAGFGLLGLAAFVALFSLLTWGPSFFPFGFSRLYVPWTGASSGASISDKDFAWRCRDRERLGPAGPGSAHRFRFAGCPAFPETGIFRRLELFGHGTGFARHIPLPAYRHSFFASILRGIQGSAIPNLFHEGYRYGDSGENRSHLSISRPIQKWRLRLWRMRATYRR